MSAEAIKTWDIVDPLQCQIRDAVMNFMREHKRATGKEVPGFSVSGIAPISPENIQTIASVVEFLRKARPSKVILFPNLMVENDVPRVKCFHKVLLRVPNRQRTIIAEWELFQVLLQADGIESRAAGAYSEALSPFFKDELHRLDRDIHAAVERFRSGPEYLGELERRKKAHFRAFHEKERGSVREHFRRLVQSRWSEEEILEVWREMECAVVMKS